MFIEIIWAEAEYANAVWQSVALKLLAERRSLSVPVVENAIVISNSVTFDDDEAASPADRNDLQEFENPDRVTLAADLLFCTRAEF